MAGQAVNSIDRRHALGSYSGAPSQRAGRGKDRNRQHRDNHDRPPFGQHPPGGFVRRGPVSEHQPGERRQGCRRVGGGQGARRVSPGPGPGS